VSRPSGANGDTRVAARAVIGDDGREITLTLCREGGAIGAVTLKPCRAVALAGELIAAALPRLEAP